MGIEVIITLGSFLVTSVMKIFAQKSANQAQIMDAALRSHRQEGEQRDSLNSKDTHFAFTRRFIAISVIVAIVIIPIATPLIISILGLDVVLVSNCTSNPDSSSLIWGLISWSSSDMDCLAGQGIMVMPWHSQLVAVIIGAYFGDRVSK